MEITDNKYFKIVAVLLPSLIIFGNISLFNIRVAGLVLTSYRILIPILCVALIWLYLKEKPHRGIKQIAKENVSLSFFCCVMVFWIAYGLMTLVLFKYSVFHEGAKEIMMLILTVPSVVSLCILCHYGCWDDILIGLRIAVLITLIIAIAEIITGKHLPTSHYSDMEFLRTYFIVPESELANIKVYNATSIFYNENDYSAFLVVAAPLFVNDICNGSKWCRLSGCLFLGAIYYIILTNDAFICVIAGALGVILALLFNKKGLLSYLYTVVTLAAARIIYAVVSSGERAIESSLLEQMNNMEMGYGSLLRRLNTYSTSFTETIRVTKGLGFGAGSYTNYFSQLAETHNMMSNPHCYWVEIFSEYGAIVEVLFIALLLLLYIKIIVYALSTERQKASLILAMGTAFAVACVAPSSYMMNTYHWIPIGMAVWLVDSMSKNAK